MNSPPAALSQWKKMNACAMYEVSLHSSHAVITCTANIQYEINLYHTYVVRNQLAQWTYRIKLTRTVHMQYKPSCTVSRSRYYDTQIWPNPRSTFHTSHQQFWIESVKETFTISTCLLSTTEPPRQTPSWDEIPLKTYQEYWLTVSLLFF